jgi:hypothetical protein
MKPVGKLDAGNRHVQFDERGGETERARATAPLLDSTFDSDPDDFRRFRPQNANEINGPDGKLRVV